MNTTVIEQALQRLGECLEYYRDVELLLVGGAAGMVTGVLPARTTTQDCDVMSYDPSEAMAAVESAAAKVGVELGLPERWLNSDAQLRLDALPDGWKRRRIWVSDSGRLHVWAISRLDLIAMKVLAGRTQDREHLVALRVRSDDAVFVRSYLESLRSKGTLPDEIDRAIELLSAWKVDNHE